MGEGEQTKQTAFTRARIGLALYYSPLGAPLGEFGRGGRGGEGQTAVRLFPFGEKTEVTGKMSQSLEQVRRILQISTRDRRGGAENCAWSLFEAYRERGLESCLAVGEKFSTDPNVWEIPHARYAATPWARAWLGLGESLSPLRQRGVRGIGFLQTRLRRLAQPSAWRKQQQGWEDFDYPGTGHLLSQLPELPDIIHCHNLHPNYFDLRALPQLSKTRPLILHLHDTWLLSGHCSYSFDCKRWQTGCGNCPYLDTYPAIRRDKSAANWERKQEVYANSHLYIVTVSQWLMDKVERSILPGVQKRVIYNGTDVSLFKPASRRLAQAIAQKEARHTLKLPLDAKIVLLIAHSSFKDYATMEAALSQIKGEPSKPLLFICLARGGSEKMVGDGRMIYPGWVAEPEKMAQYYRAADIYIHAALDEAFGKTITEAGASGTPVVATAVGGIPEQIKEGQTGFLVPPKAPQAMASAIQTLLDDDELRTRMGQAAAAHIRQHFGLQRQVDQFLAWYDEVLADWQASHHTTAT